MSERFEGTLSRGEMDVILERRRHESEGITPASDDDLRNMELAYAAGCYVAPVWKSDADMNAGEPPIGWPGHRDDWKPKDYRRNLIRGASLIFAEIDRFDRLADREAGS
ncbi:hypothetical protein RA307_09915 [Xanthobacteraceae bacterium Astr-EGSB]|uniref:hypothetical protein n=1 Tax=Astrobacterium formosum TaxID=3069710 RepID=UPI0027ADE789|nr:hypothetical protein [Xanthobacteraceae bacterium Astr-EGSB]